VVLAAFFSNGMAIGSSQYAFGIFVDPLESEFAWSRAQINASLSFAAFSSLIAPFVGKLMDKIGARPIMTISLVLLATSFILRPFMTELWHWYVLSALQFAGFPGAAILPAGRLVGIWFKETRGRMMGLVTMGNNFGGMTITPLVSLVVGMTSWKEGYQVMGVLALLIALISLVVVRESVPAKTVDDTLDILNTPSKKGSSPAAVIDLPGVSADVAFRSRCFVGVAAAVLLANFTYSAVLTQIIPHLTNEGLTLAKASSLLTLMAAFGMAGKLIFGYVSERISAKYTFVLSLGGQIIGLVAVILAGTSPLLWIAIPIFGLPFGGIGALFPLLVQEMFGLKAFGAIFGMVNVVTVVSFLGGPLFVGLIVDQTGSYVPAFLIMAGIFFIGGLVALTLHPLEN
jgi:MFS family permease